MKVSRDKRGYETYYLVEPGPGHPHQSRPRVLFWYRTPPGVKVGREPFSEEIRQAIESQNPDLTFDWPRLMATQPPSLEAQRWRERRRLERAQRQAAREEEPEDAGTTVLDVEAQPRHSIEAAADAEAVDHAPQASDPAVSDSTPSDAPGPASAGRRRRRRRRGRHHGAPQPESGGPQPQEAAGEPAAASVDPVEPPPSSDEV